jgi:hypothetical protein
MWKDCALGILVLLAAIIIVPNLLLMALAGVLITIVLSPFIAVASLWFGEGEGFGERFGNNLVRTFGHVLDGIGNAW